jgi:hypothetical protein
MNGLQRTIVVATLLGVATFLHFFLCDWVSSPLRLDSFETNVTRTIVPLGPYAGIHARSSNSVTFDAIAGVAVPLLMVGGALYVAAGGRRSD